MVDLDELNTSCDGLPGLFWLVQIPGFARGSEEVRPVTEVVGVPVGVVDATTLLASCAVVSPLEVATESAELSEPPVLESMAVLATLPLGAG